MARRLLALATVAVLLLALAALPAAGAEYPPPTGPTVTIDNPGGTITVNTDDGNLTGAEVVIERDDDDDAQGRVLATGVDDNGVLSFAVADLDGATQVRISGTDAEGADYSEVYELSALLAGDGDAEAVAGTAGSDAAEGDAAASGDVAGGAGDAAAVGGGDDPLGTQPAASVGGLTPGLAGGIVLLVFGLVGALLARDVGRRLGGSND